MANADAEKLISFVIPAYDEEGNIGPLLREVCDVAAASSLDIEIIVVDDGSTDATWARVAEAAEADGRVRGIRFRRNFGKAAALMAGFHAARGALVFTLDADLQDNPVEVPRFLAKIDEGYDSVTGWKRDRHDPWHKVIPSRVFNFLVSTMTGVKLHDHNCGYKCHRAEVVAEIRLYGEQHRFVPVLAAARGFRIAEIEVNHRPRTRGRSKYGARRFLKGFLDLLTVKFLTGYGQRPLHVFGSVGLVAFALGALGLTYLAGFWLAQQWFAEAPEPIYDRPLLLYSLGGLLLGAQLLSVGFVAELMTAHGMREDPAYSISEQTPATSRRRTAEPTSGVSA